MSEQDECRHKLGWDKNGNCQGCGFHASSIIAGLEVRVQAEREARRKDGQTYFESKQNLAAELVKQSERAESAEARALAAEKKLGSAKAFHRNICKLAGWEHDDKDWLRDLACVEESIRQELSRFRSAVPESPEVKEAMAAIDDYSDGSKHDWRKIAHTLAFHFRARLAEKDKRIAELGKAAPGAVSENASADKCIHVAPFPDGPGTCPTCATKKPECSECLSRFNAYANGFSKRFVPCSSCSQPAALSESKGDGR